MPISIITMYGKGNMISKKRFETRFEESTSTEVDSSVPLTHYDPKNLGLICQ